MEKKITKTEPKKYMFYCHEYGIYDVSMTEKDFMESVINEGYYDYTWYEIDLSKVEKVKIETKLVKVDN